MAADGVLLVTPEYNNSIPGVFKNAIDWLSRPPADASRVFGGRRFAIMGASPGRLRHDPRARAAWLPVLRTLGAQLWTGGRLTVSRADNVFDEGGTLKDAAIEEQLQAVPRGYVTFLRARRRRSASRQASGCASGAARTNAGSASRCAQIARSRG